MRPEVETTAGMMDSLIPDDDDDVYDDDDDS